MKETNEETIYRLYNFVTDEMDELSVFPDENLEQYIPQDTLELYDLYRQMGKSAREAMEKIFLAIAEVHAEMERQ